MIKMFPGKCSRDNYLNVISINMTEYGSITRNISLAKLPVLSSGLMTSGFPAEAL